jgi:hypothetical protein
MILVLLFSKQGRLSLSGGQSPANSQLLATLGTHSCAAWLKSTKIISSNCSEILELLLKISQQD